MSQVQAAAAARPGPARPAAAGLRAAVRAEWTKLRTVSGPGWLLAALVILTIGVSAAALAGSGCPHGDSCPVDTTRLSLVGVDFGQALAAILGVLAISNEYSTGMIRVTLTAMPRRLVVLAAKAGLLAAVVLAGGAVAAAGAVLAGRLILPGNGFTPARGFALESLAHGATLRAAGGSALYLALIALLGLGVATIARDSAVAIGTVLGLLYLVPVVVVVLANPVWQRRLERYAPMNAGLAIQATTGLRTLPISPWDGLGVLALWAAAALLGGTALLLRRDA